MGDLAWAEVVAAVAARVPEGTRLQCTAVGSFETISTGFALAQLALAGADLRPAETIVFANTAPRKDLTDARRNNEGEGLLYGRLRNGVPILAVNSGYSLSFVLSDLAELYSVHVQDDGSQFRSRDYFPAVIGKLARGDLSFRNQQLAAAEVVPELPYRVIAYVDSFGNLKTTFRARDKWLVSLTSGSRVKVTIGGVVRTATVATGSFNVMEGDLAFAPGSSGHDCRFWEFFQRGGSAHAEFGHPPVGAKIEITMS